MNNCTRPRQKGSFPPGSGLGGVVERWGEIGRAGGVEPPDQAQLPPVKPL
ncbi:MAG: hypothetical protein NTW03_07040 [Verrucomicrobia bacterium]|nr:hypothetical protein [Verrucomicrobiota bacterium]